MLENVECDFCHAGLTINPNIGVDPPVMWLAPGLVYYPTAGFGSYNGAEVHMLCAIRYQQHCISEHLMEYEYE